MSLDLVVRGDPEACRAAAHRLTTIAATAQSTGDGLARAAGIGDADFGGLAGDAFRAHARELAGSADDAAHRCRRVARALCELALDLEDVRRLMARARAAAEPWLLVTGGAVLAPHAADATVPEATFPEAAHAAWAVAAQLVAEARRIEARAQLDWAGCVRQVAQDLPLVPYDPALGPHLPGHAPPDDGRHQHRDRGPAGPDTTDAPAVPAPPFVPTPAASPSCDPARDGDPGPIPAPIPAPTPAPTPAPASVGTAGVGHLPLAGFGCLAETERDGVRDERR